MHWWINQVAYASSSRISEQHSRVVVARQGVRCFHAALALTALAVAFITVGCSADECASGEARCNGNVVEICGRGEDDQHNVWSRQQCGAGFCHLSSDAAPPSAFCAVSNEPDPRCGGVTDLGVCDDNVALVCHQGYATSVSDCTNGTRFQPPFEPVTTDAGFCAATGTWAQCVLESTPNPLCPPTAQRAFVCDGGRKLLCSYGYVVGLESCDTDAG